MGAKPRPLQPLTLPRGVKIRRHRSRESIQIAFTYKGRQCRETLRGVLADGRGVAFAARQLRAIQDEINAGVFDYAQRFPRSSFAKRSPNFTPHTTFRDFARWYAGRFWVSNQKSTNAGYESSLRHRLLPALGGMPLQHITREYLLEFISAQGKELVLKSIRNLASVLSMILDEAYAQKLIPGNPLGAGGLKVRKLVPKEMRGRGKKIDPFTLSEMERIVNAATGQMRNLIEFWRWTGLRTGEILGLRWSTISFSRKMAIVDNNVVNREEKGPKTAQGNRAVELSEPAIAALRAQQVYTGEGERVFVNLRTGLPLTVSNEVWSEWVKVIRRAEVRYRRPFQLRHTYASTLITEGANLKWLAGQLGHGDSIEMINKHYGAFIVENSPRNVDRLVASALSKRKAAIAAES